MGYVFPRALCCSLAVAAADPVPFFMMYLHEKNSISQTQTHGGGGGGELGGGNELSINQFICGKK